MVSGMRKVTRAVLGGLLIVALTGSTALAAGPGASSCGHAAGQETAGAARAFTGLGTIVRQMAPLNQVNHASLFACSP
jgi:hypothetical protein